MELWLRSMMAEMRSDPGVATVLLSDGTYLTPRPARRTADPSEPSSKERPPKRDSRDDATDGISPLAREPWETAWIRR